MNALNDNKWKYWVQITFIKQTKNCRLSSYLTPERPIVGLKFQVFRGVLWLLCVWINTKCTGYKLPQWVTQTMTTSWQQGLCLPAWKSVVIRFYPRRLDSFKFWDLWINCTLLLVSFWPECWSALEFNEPTGPWHMARVSYCHKRKYVIEALKFFLTPFFFPTCECWVTRKVMVIVVVVVVVKPLFKHDELCSLLGRVLIGKWANTCTWTIIVKKA